jgi:hypothetical protein
MAMMGPVELLLLLLVLGAGAAVVISVVVAASRRSAVTASPPHPALPGPDPVLARIRTIAWDSREIDAPLADALIGYLNEHEGDRDQRAVRNEVGEIAWQHRETCPNLSTIVIDALRNPG